MQIGGTPNAGDDRMLTLPIRRCGAMDRHEDVGPLYYTGSSYSPAAREINRSLENLSAECGMCPARVSSRSARAGRATAIYANGVGPIDIQRWGRWKSTVYMRYVWRENVRLQTMSFALTRRTNLSDNSLARDQTARKVPFQTPYRCGWKIR